MQLRKLQAIARLRAAVFVGLLAGAAVGCDDPVDVPPDAGEVADADIADAEIADAEPADAEPADAGMRRFKVRANGLVPAVGTSSNAARRVQGGIVTPTGGEASNPRRTVRSVIGAPRSGN